jgi:hypothetical protein
MVWGVAPDHGLLGGVRAAQATTGASKVALPTNIVVIYLLVKE